MDGITTHDARNAKLILTVRYDPTTKTVSIDAVPEQVDHTLVQPWMQKYILSRAGRIRQIVEALREKLPQVLTEEGTAEFGAWSYQAAWSDNGGYIVRTGNAAMGKLFASLLPDIFPITGGGVPGSTSYRGHGWISDGPTEWVWENSSFGIGD